MRIDTIEIENFKGFEKEVFCLNPQFTIFIGENAKGKTSVLDALAIAAGSFFIGIEGVSSRTIQEREIRIITIDGQPKPQKPVNIKATWNFSEQDRAIWDFNKRHLSFTWERGIIKKNTTTKDAKKLSHFAEKLLRESRLKSGTIFPVIAYHGTGRLWALHEKLDYQKQGEGVIRAYSNSLSAKSSPKAFLEWFKTQEDSVSKFNEALDSAHLNAFKKAITNLIPDERWQNVAFDNKEGDLIGTFITESGDREKLKFSQLSDGFKNVIAMAADIAYRCIQLNPHLGENVIEETPGIVLIDELDLHLHPNWQKRIVDDLKNAFPKIQFIATTHSPFIVQSLKSVELINLDEVNGLDEDPNKYSIEEVSAKEMGIENVERSNTFLEMQKLATIYFDLIKSNASNAAIESAKSILDELRIKYNNDPAYVALLASELPKENL